MICHLFLSSYVENQVKIASLGGIEAIVSAMKTHSGHEGVQEKGCMALVNLSANAGVLSLSCTVHPFSL